MLVPLRNPAVHAPQPSKTLEWRLKADEIEYDEHYLWR
jgi:hypothetical protein